MRINMSKIALLLIDFQNDYFQSGKRPLTEIESAVNHGAKLLSSFREKGLPIIHVRHVSKTNDAPVFVPDSVGAKFYSTVVPLPGEYNVVKNNINSFRNTNLKEILDNEKIESIFIVGATSHLCIDAVIRAASDFGFNCTVAYDACATSELEFNGITVQASHVHASFMSALGYGYAKVLSTNTILTELK